MTASAWVGGGEDPAFRAVLDRIGLVARSRLAVVFTGPTGAGKTTLARCLHELSGRRGRFVVVDCPTLRPALFASELFGHVRGAFTGADRDARGKVEAARGGTLFLEEVGDLDRENQAQLLSFLGTGRYTPVGADEERQAEVRVVAATNLELGTLRADLVRRIADEVIRVPGLDERPLDIVPLAERLAAEWASREGWRSRPLSADAAALLVARTWPDNVGGLSREVHRALLRAEREAAPLLLPRHFELPEPQLPRTLDGKLAALEGLVVADALRRHDHNVTEAARALGVPRQRLHRRIRELDVARAR